MEENKTKCIPGGVATNNDVNVEAFPASCEIENKYPKESTVLKVRKHTKDGHATPSDVLLIALSTTKHSFEHKNSITTINSFKNLPKSVESKTKLPLMGGEPSENLAVHAGMSV